MADSFAVHMREAVKDLAGKVLDVAHWKGLSPFLSRLELLLQGTVTELHDRVLNDPLARICGVEKVKQLHYVWRAF